MRSKNAFPSRLTRELAGALLSSALVLHILAGKQVNLNTMFPPENAETASATYLPNNSQIAGAQQFMEYNYRHRRPVPFAHIMANCTAANGREFTVFRPLAIVVGFEPSGPVYMLLSIQANPDGSAVAVPFALATTQNTVRPLDGSITACTLLDGNEQPLIDPLHTFLDMAVFDPDNSAAQNAAIDPYANGNVVISVAPNVPMPIALKVDRN